MGIIFLTELNKKSDYDIIHKMNAASKNKMFYISQLIATSDQSIEYLICLQSALNPTHNDNL